MKNILQSKTEEVNGEWRKSANGLCGLYFSSRIQEIKLRSMKWAWRVMCGEQEECVWYVSGKTVRKDTLKMLGINGKTYSKMVCKQM